MTYTLESAKPVPAGSLRALLDTGDFAMFIPVPEMLDPAARRKLQKDVEYLMGANTRGISVHIDPTRLTEALENVTRHLLRELNARLAVRPMEPFDNWHSVSCPARGGEVNCTCER